MKTFATPIKKRDRVWRRPTPRTTRLPAAAPEARTDEIRQILHGPRLQTKLTIGAPDDAYEREADGASMRCPEEDLEAADAPPEWLEVAQRETGTRGEPGAEHNPRIVEYHQTTTLRATEDEVPWCSSFVNWCMKKAGEGGTDSAAARSWLDWGDQLEEPRTGCVVVFSRGQNPKEGHVAFFLKDHGAMLEVLGGNQGNQVKVSLYARERLLGFRWPSARDGTFRRHRSPLPREKNACAQPSLEGGHIMP